MSKQSIWTFFKQHTQLPEEAIAGIMGNMEAESNCEACRVQGDFTADRRTSKQYAQDVNAGTISRNSFMYDAKGWGLCQWTFYSRKQNLYHACQSYGTGIEDETTQLRFFLAEMQTEYPAVWKALLNATTIQEAARVVCVDYERPAVPNVVARTDYGQQIYNKFHGKDLDPEPEPDPAEDWLQDWIEYLEAEKQRIQTKIEELKARRSR